MLHPHPAHPPHSLHNPSLVCKRCLIICHLRIRTNFCTSISRIIRNQTIIWTSSWRLLNRICRIVRYYIRNQTIIWTSSWDLIIIYRFVNCFIKNPTIICSSPSSDIWTVSMAIMRLLCLPAGPTFPHLSTLSCSQVITSMTGNISDFLPAKLPHLWQGTYQTFFQPNDHIYDREYNRLSYSQMITSMTGNISEFLPA